MTHEYKSVHHPCTWTNPDGLSVAPPVTLEQWDFRGGSDYWSAKAIVTDTGEVCDVDPRHCNPVSSWDLGEPDEFVYCNGAWLPSTDGWMYGLVILGLVGVAVALG